MRPQASICPVSYTHLAIAEDESSGMNYLCETVEGGPHCTIRTEKEAGVGGLLIKNRITPEIAELFTGIPMNNRK